MNHYPLPRLNYAIGTVDLDFNLPDVQRLLIRAIGLAMQKAGRDLEMGRSV